MADKANYNESKVPDYTVPSALTAKDGRKIKNAFEWTNYQRAYIQKLFEENMYGAVPPRPDELRFEVLNVKNGALNGLAVRKEIRIHCKMNDGRSTYMDMLLYVPSKAKGPVPAFAGLNFMGNHTTTDEDDVKMPDKPCYAGTAFKERALQKHRWQFEKLIERGYAAATMYYFDIYPDRPDGRNESIYALFEKDNIKLNGGAISAWAWGLSRMMDCLESMPEIDSSRIAVHGHSRLGKSALWAGATDRRFAMVISNDSGCCGAALSRRCFGETLELINIPVSYWFNPAIKKYVNKEHELPVDQHMLIALAAPRPVCVSSATEDLWADPKGEFLSTSLAGEVYELFGSKGLNSEKMPPADTPILNDLGYQLRTGKHDMTEQDWNFYLNFADKHFKK